MNKHWMIVLALLVFAIGCDQKEKAEMEKQDAIQNAKVAEAQKKQKRGVMSKPGETSDEAPKEDEKADEDAKPDDGDAKSEDAKTDGESDGDEEKTETSAKLNAKKVLNEAIAAAKSDNKALFVYSTSAG